jgi:hypothetical protein
MTKRWWTVLLASGLATMVLHLHLARAAAPSLNTVLLHFGILFVVFLAALTPARVLGQSQARRVLLWTFLVGGVSLAVYIPSPLLLSPEVQRYRWDGAAAEAGYNPYQVTPDTPILEPIRETIDAPIPRPGRGALYPPLAELLFYAMARFNANTVVHYRILFSALAFLGGLAFLPLCRGAEVPVTRVIVFLWHPLLILETAANAHIEALAVFFVLASLALLINRHQLTPVASLAVAVLTKAYPLAMLPLYVRRVPPYRILLFFLMLVGACLPFIGAGRELWRGVFDYMGNDRFNAGLYLGFEALFRFLGHPEWAWLAVGAAGLAVAFTLYVTDDGSNASILRRGFYLVVPPILLGPVLRPWYLLWLIPFLALVGPRNPLRMAFLYLSGSVILSYLAVDWGHLPWWVTVMELGPVPLLAAWGFWKTRGGGGDEAVSGPGRPAPMSGTPG